jgi:hypothetical protein
LPFQPFQILKNVYISGFSTPLKKLKVMMQLVDARREKAQVGHSKLI